MLAQNETRRAHSGASEATHLLRTKLIVLPLLLVLAACDEPLDESVVIDTDGDGIGDQSDNCVDFGNAGQTDSDGDGRGDVCDDDRDGDGFGDTIDCDPDDRLLGAETAFYADEDGDGLGDPARWRLACTAPEAYVADSTDDQPGCASNVVDECGICDGPGAPTWHPDADGDGLGDARTPVTACAAPDGFVNNALDDEPECADADRDACGVCNGGDRGLDCAGVCFGPSRLDDCGNCDGPGKYIVYADVDGDGLGDPSVATLACDDLIGFVDNADDPEPACVTNNSDVCGVCGGLGEDRDCAGICFGEAFVDACEVCVGGVTGREPSTRDADRDGLPDRCDLCTNSEVARTVIQWNAVPPYTPPGGPYTFQLVLWANGDWAYLYEEIEPYMASATVGWQGPGGTPAIELGYNADYVRDHRRILFRRNDEGTPLLDYTVPVEWVDIAETGAELELGDDATAVVPLYFEFEFGDETFAELLVSANGYVSFDGTNPGYNNTNLPNLEIGTILAVLWDDLNPAEGGEIWVRHFDAGCRQDCVGDFGGAAVVDSCDVCVGGRAEARSEEHIDCAGTCFGVAEFDSCGDCAGGESGVEPAPEEACDRLPDLVVDRRTLRNSVFVDYVDVGDDACLVAERCVGGTGLRKVIRFSTQIANVGTGDLRLGAPRDMHPWHYDECHSHYHYEHYAAYDLYDVANEVLLPIGAKAGFCVMDSTVFDGALAPAGCAGYDCTDQGISRGCADIYSSSLQCQWIDVTDVVDGVYDVIVTTNPDGEIDELDTTNNSASVRVEMTGDTLRIVEDDE